MGPPHTTRAAIAAETVSHLEIKSSSLRQDTKGMVGPEELIATTEFTRQMLICRAIIFSPGKALQVKGKVAKKYALYPPKDIVEQLRLREGQSVTYELAGRQLVVKPIEDPLELAVRSKKWAKTSIREFEAESLRQQDEFSN